MHCVTFNIPEMIRIIKNQFLLFAKVTFYFLGATRSIEPFSYGNVAGWLGGWLSGWLSVTPGIVSKRLNLYLKTFSTV